MLLRSWTCDNVRQVKMSCLSFPLRSCCCLLTRHGVLSFPGAQRVRGQPRDALLPHHAPQPWQAVPHLVCSGDNRWPRQHQRKGHRGTCWERWVLQASLQRRRVKRGWVKVTGGEGVTFIPQPSPLRLHFLSIDWQLLYWSRPGYIVLLIMWWWTGAI